MRCNGRSTVALPVIFCTNASPAAKDIARKVHELICVRSMGQIVDGR